MKVTGRALPSTQNNVSNDVLGGRKTFQSIDTATIDSNEGGVLVNVVGADDAVIFSDEVVSYDDTSEDDDDETEEESEEEWESEEEEEEYDEEDAELDEGLAERLRILADARALKTLAEAFLHPEIGVKNTDGTSLGRNYYERPSAPQRMEDEEADEVVDILEDVLLLKKAAAAWLHPEIGVTKVEDPTVFGRNYFNRGSAPEVEDVEEAEERVRIMEETASLKQSVIDWTHPEFGVVTSDPFACGRNYFNRPSAPETEDDEYADERADALADAAALKKIVIDWTHPEVGVKKSTTDGTAFGRNYFNRYSAPETEDMEDAIEAARVLAEATSLKKSAMDYMHPEVGVSTTDATACGRNYFNRYSAPETEEDELADERAEILEEVAALKKSAVAWLHPEVGVNVEDSTLFGRNYFNRYSAPEVEDMDDSSEAARVLADALMLKKNAVDYMHPELGVVTCDATGTHATLRGNACGRNYFNRYSAPETEDVEEAEERACILADAVALKKSAVAWTHPEVGVTSVDATAFGRNYFNRYSAPETEEDEFADERAEILEEAAALKKSAAAWLHPEVGITESAPESFGRNYFDRYSADDVEDMDDSFECARVLADAMALKKSAIDYLHPEVGVTTTDATACGRNYFNRYSAPETEDEEFAEESARILADAVALEKSAVQYIHPEKPIEVDATAFGRNYFTRYSAPLNLPEQASEQDESPEESQDVTTVKSLAAAVKGANLPSTKSTKLSSSDSEFSATKKSASSVNLFGLTEEVV